MNESVNLWEFPKADQIYMLIVDPNVKTRKS